MLQSIINPRGFFDALGDMHDARIESVSWSRACITVVVDDLYSAFLGLPNYKGPLRGSIMFWGVRSVQFSGDAEQLTMYSIEIQDVPADGTIMVELRLSPGGHIQVLCEAVLGDVDVQAVLAALQLA